MSEQARSDQRSRRSSRPLIPRVVLSPYFHASSSREPSEGSRTLPRRERASNARPHSHASSSREPPKGYRTLPRRERASNARPFSHASSSREASPRRRGRQARSQQDQG